MLKNHPPGLVVCFTTELWERFSYYGMRALLVFYLTQHFLFSDDASYLIYGAYTSMVYMTPVVGGIIADRYLGSRKAVTLGAILLSLGHLLMTVEGAPAREVFIDGAVVIERDPLAINIFYLSLALIITGVGFLKSNISTVVGALYEPDDPRRDPGFTIFYMGINIGAASAPIICGWLGHVYGWRYGFGLAGVGMLLGLVGFLRGQKHLEGHADPPHPEWLRERVFPGLQRETAIYLGATSLVGLVWLIMQYRWIIGHMLTGSGVVMGTIILFISFNQCTRIERDRLMTCSVLIAFTIGFWAFYELKGSSVNLFTDRMVDRVVFGFEIPAAQLQSLAAIFIVLLGPWFSMLWIRLARRGWEPSTPIKFVLGIGLLGAGFLVLGFGTRLSGDGQVTLIWLVLMVMLVVMGELCLSPVGMSMVTKLSPTRIVGMMMGTFFLAYSASSFISALIARLSSADTIGGELVDRAAALDTYASVYTTVGLMALAVAALLLVFSPTLRRGMHEGE
jgi:POT family proton-dependent oligopeptide transporter